MKVLVYGDRTSRIVSGAVRLVAAHGMHEVGEAASADFAVAPRLFRKLSPAELQCLPTLVFHPSLLPRHRGRDAIRWAFELAEPYSGVTWFWADDGYDTGDICEQAVIEIRRGIDTPRTFYDRAIDEGLRLLDYALADIRRGVFRRRPQRLEAQTYEHPFPRT